VLQVVANDEENEKGSQHWLGPREACPDAHVAILMKYSDDDYKAADDATIRRLVRKFGHGCSIKLVRRWFQRRTESGWTHQASSSSLAATRFVLKKKSKASKPSCDKLPVDSRIISSFLSPAECADLLKAVDPIVRGRSAKVEILGTNDPAKARVAYALFSSWTHCIETKKQATERKQLHELFTETKLYARVTEQVRNFIEEHFSRQTTRRPKPRRVMPRRRCSIRCLQEDPRTSFCTAIVCLAGDSRSDQSLILGEASAGSAQQTALKAGDLLIFKRLYHTVPDCVRAADRITINMFF
jgi:hypothetical protein